MISKLSEVITGEQIVSWLIIAILVVYFIYKEWPEFKKRVSKKAIKETTDAQLDRTVGQRLDAIETDVKEIKAKLDRDYNRINEMEIKHKRFQKLVADSLEERELLMGAMLGVLGGLQELGANGKTKEAERNIRDYLNRQAHKEDEVI